MPAYNKAFPILQSDKSYLHRGYNGIESIDGYKSFQTHVIDFSKKCLFSVNFQTKKTEFPDHLWIVNINESYVGIRNKYMCMDVYIVSVYYLYSN